MRRTPSTSQNSTAEPSWSLNRLVSATGTTKNRPIASARPPTTAPAHIAPEISSSSSGSCALAEMLSALKPMLSDSASATTPRTTGQRSARWRFAHETSGNDWTSISPWAASPTSSSRPSGDLLGQRLADGDGPRGDAAHHHAFEDRLPAHRGVTLGLEGGVWQAELSGTPIGSADPGADFMLRQRRQPPRLRLAARRWKRSTRPPVSTSFCLPV